MHCDKNLLKLGDTGLMGVQIRVGIVRRVTAGVAPPPYQVTIQPHVPQFDGVAGLLRAPLIDVHGLLSCPATGPPCAQTCYSCGGASPPPPTTLLP